MPANLAGTPQAAPGRRATAEAARRRV